MNDGQSIASKLPISDATKRRNPHLFGMGAVVSDSPKRAPLQALVKGVQKPAGSEAGVQVRITLVAYRRRLLDDHDAVAYACKPLADEIAERLGVDDNDKRLVWEYHQIKTSGSTGTAVKIEVQQKACKRRAKE